MLRLFVVGLIIYFILHGCSATEDIDTTSDGSLPGKEASVPHEDGEGPATGCTADKYFCEDNKIRLCANDGKTSTLYHDCTQGDYASFEFICTPCTDQPAPKCVANKPFLTGTVVLDSILDLQNISIVFNTCTYLLGTQGSVTYLDALKYLTVSITEPISDTTFSVTVSDISKITSGTDNDLYIAGYQNPISVIVSKNGIHYNNHGSYRPLDTNQTIKITWDGTTKGSKVSISVNNATLYNVDANTAYDLTLSLEGIIQ